IESSLNSKIFSHVIVSTEDKEIASVAKKYGAEVPFMRPKNLAQDKTSFNDVLMHGIKMLHSIGYDFDIIVNRDCTVPLIRDKDVDGSIKLLKRKKCDAVFGVYRQHHNPYFNMMELNSKGFLEFSKTTGKRVERRQSAPIVYQLNGLFTLYTDRFLKFHSFFMPRCLPFEIPPETGLMIDTEIEFQIVEMLLKRKLKIK
ncbi:MAG: acylneuraminate cytidylyltransferase family protein, partial [Nitrosotalea sp.]